MLVLTVLALCFISNASLKPLNKATGDACGYASCVSADPAKLNVHVVPHSHDDVGWLKTVDQYYYGENSTIQGAGVQYIIESAIHALSQNPNRRFIQVETAFFYKWWNKQSEDEKEKVRNLVNSGQLEFIGGAWSMNDEAAVHYQSTIDQFTLGLRVLNETLGECARPKVGWQIDPFGHSREQASIFARMGYDGFFFSRLDWRDKTQRMNEKTAEIIWKGSSSLEGNVSHIFTSALYNHYSAPSGFCFDVKCSDDPIVDDEESPLYNLKDKVEAFAEFIRKQASNYKTNNIIITMGDDFHYQDALSYFTSLDRLIEGFNEFQQEYEGKIINVFYSTPSCYLKAVNDAALENGIAFPTKSDDFFPYATDPHTYWTGYYTSRPTSKRFERQGNNLLQVVKQLASFKANTGDIDSLKQAMGVMQHHDAITGTEKQHVAHDYHRLLHKAVQKSIAASSETILNLLSEDGSTENLELASCLLANMTICPQSNAENFLVIVYNPLSRIVSHYVKLPVDSTSFSILDPNDQDVKFQVAKTPRSFEYTQQKTSKYDLVFRAENLPPLGFKVYSITNLDPNADNSTLESIEDDGKYTIGNDAVTLQINASTGKLANIILNATTYEIEQELMYYESAEGDNSEFAKRASGAYIFRPSPEHPEAISVTNSINITTYKGDLFEEIHQEYNTWLTQVIRVYKMENYIEFDWIVGPIDTEDNIGKEVISRFTTNLQSDDTFYTDSNGREILKRIRDYRSDYNFTDQEESVSQNYYPVTSRIVLKDEEKDVQLSILNDRAQGGTSLRSGQVELMLHRKCLRDDAFGVGESLQEEEYEQGLVARGQLYLNLGSITGKTGEKAIITERNLAQRTLLAPWIFLSATTSDFPYENIKKEFSGISAPLPLNTQLLTLEPLDDTSVLIRLEHIFEKDEDEELSKPTSVPLDGLFKTFEITSLQETALAADRWIEEMQRLDWNTGESGENGETFTPIAENFNITLNPMEIRTFVASIKRV